MGPHRGGFEVSELPMAFETVVGLSAVDSRWSLFTLLTYDSLCSQISHTLYITYVLNYTVSELFACSVIV